MRPGMLSDASGARGEGIDGLQPHLGPRLGVIRGGGVNGHHGPLSSVHRDEVRGSAGPFELLAQGEQECVSVAGE